MDACKWATERASLQRIYSIKIWPSSLQMLNIHKAISMSPRVFQDRPHLQKEEAQMRALFRELVNHLDNELHTPGNQDRAARSDVSRSSAAQRACSFYRMLIASIPVVVTFRLCSRSFPRALRDLCFHGAAFFLFLFLPLPPYSRRKTLRDWIKIAGAISRTHDIGENATEALIMADTRRAVAATTFYPLTQDSHYTNVPPIIGPQSAALPLPREPRPRVSQSLQSESCKPTRKSNSSTPPRRYRQHFCETIVVRTLYLFVMAVSLRVTRIVAEPLPPLVSFNRFLQPPPDCTVKDLLRAQLFYLYERYS